MKEVKTVAESAEINIDGGGSRLHGLDLLRIVLMIMVCILHALNQFGTLFVQGANADTTVYFSMLLELLSVMAVNAWILTSGYLLINTEFKLKRFFELLLTVIFYSAFVFVLFQALKASHITDIAAFKDGGSFSGGGMFGLVQGLFPISSEHYFFMTWYLILYIISPILNIGALKISKEKFRLLLVLFIIWCSLIKSVIPVNFAADDLGYGFRWFVCLYLTGAYLRLHVDSKRISAKKWLFVYVISVLINYCISAVLFIINGITGGFSYFMYVPLHYNFIFNLTAAIGLFMFFKSLKINKKMKRSVKYIAGHTLGVYLLHAHPLFFNSWKELIAAVLGNPPVTETLNFLIYLLICVVILFCAGIAVDIVREALFKRLKWI